MPENDRGIGSEGLEQGGPNLGNDYSRSVGSRGNTDARDAVILPNETRENRSDDSLNMDNESSRNLSGELTGNYDASNLEDDTDEDDDDMMEDDVLQGMDKDDDDDDDDEENDII